MVCSVGKGTVAEYYLNEQAEYYTGGKEPQGHWYTPCGVFNLEDGAGIDAAIFKRLHSGISPDGVSLGQKNQSFDADRIGGYDLTFSAPKSVSVLWAVGGEDVRAVIERAQEVASRSALDVLRENASYCRRGKGGATLERVEFFGATFQHGEARPTVRADGTVASDPQLHTHSVVFNTAQRADGTWGALDGRHFYKWKMTAGAIYRARLAHELSQNLGVEIEVTQKGLFEISSVPETVRDHFSSRRSMIKVELSAQGLKSTDAQALASAITRTSRRTKSTISDIAEDRHDRWRKEAEGLGLTEQEISKVINAHEKQEAGIPSHLFDDKVKEIPRHLTEHDAVFRLETLYRASAEIALETGASTDQVEQAVAEMLEGGEVLEIGSDEIGLPIYSTKEMIEVENTLIDVAKRGSVSRKLRLPVPSIETRTQSTELSDEQCDAVKFVTTGADVAVLEGAAGAGKTYALRTVSEAYKDKGYNVIGTSTAWRMANQLGDDLSIPSKATDAWLAQDKLGKPFLDQKSVLIVDESGQLSSRQMLKVLSAAEQAGAKVILTGDQKQLQAIGAGPGLRLVAEQTGVVRIDTIVRQKEAWARKAVEDLSLGRADKAITAFETKGALKWCVDGKGAVNSAVSDWKEFKANNFEKTALVMAKTNKQVRELNEEMRAHLRKSGYLRGKDNVIKVVDSSGKESDLNVAVGDQIMFKKRIDELNVINGSAGTVTGVKQEATGFKLSVNIQGNMVQFKTEDIADEKGRIPLAHGYASTVYSAQGATVDTAFVIADQSLKRNGIYVAASRARGDCKIYVDKESVERSVRTKMPLSDLSKALVPLSILRNQLAASWSQAQEKNSTRDYISVHSTIQQAELGSLSTNAARAEFQSAFPHIEQSL